MVASTAVLAGVEVGKLLLQAYFAWSRQQGMTEEQMKAHFAANFAKFMEVSAQPVEPVKP